MIDVCWTRKPLRQELVHPVSFLPYTRGVEYRLFVIGGGTNSKVYRNGKIITFAHVLAYNSAKKETKFHHSRRVMSPRCCGNVSQWFRKKILFYGSKFLRETPPLSEHLLLEINFDMLWCRCEAQTNESVINQFRSRLPVSYRHESSKKVTFLKMHHKRQSN